jgi:hypothetical protein
MAGFVEEDRTAPPAWPHLQNKDKVTVTNVHTVPSGTIVGEKQSSVKS